MMLIYLFKTSCIDLDSKLFHFRKLSKETTNTCPANCIDKELKTGVWCECEKDGKPLVMTTIEFNAGDRDYMYKTRVFQDCNVKTVMRSKTYTNFDNMTCPSETTCKFKKKYDQNYRQYIYIERVDRHGDKGGLCKTAVRPAFYLAFQEYKYTLQLEFVANPFISGCLCYLHVAREVGFKNFNTYDGKEGDKYYNKNNVVLKDKDSVDRFCSDRNSVKFRGYHKLWEFQK